MSAPEKPTTDEPVEPAQEEPEEEITITEEADIEPEEVDVLEEQIPSPEEIKELRRMAAERDGFLNDLQRARADYLNLQRRVERDRADWRRQAIVGFTAELLAVLDQLDMAISATENHTNIESLLQGISLVRDSFLGALLKQKIEPIPAENQPFDPNLHEALMQEENSEVPDLTIIQELRKGYTIDGKVIRPAQVKVARNPGSEAPKSEVDTE